MTALAEPGPRYRMSRCVRLRALVAAERPLGRSEEETADQEVGRYGRMKP